jgi:hypothetical protein
MKTSENNLLREKITYIRKELEAKEEQRIADLNGTNATGFTQEDFIEQVRTTTTTVCPQLCLPSTLFALN